MTSYVVMLSRSQNRTFNGLDRPYPLWSRSSSWLFRQTYVHTYIYTLYGREEVGHGWAVEIELFQG